MSCRWLLALAAISIGCGDDAQAQFDAGPVIDAAPTGLSCQDDFGADDACGGDPSGTWDVSEACSDFDYTDLIEDQCSNAVQASAVYDVTGELAVSGSSFAYTVSGTVTVEVGIPASCVINSCLTLQGILQGIADSAACEPAVDGCDCTLTFPANSGSSGSYTTAGGVATVDDGSEWYYCRDQDQLLLREKDTPADEPGVTFLLQRR